MSEWKEFFQQSWKELLPHHSTSWEPSAETSSEPLSSLHFDSGFAAVRVRQPQGWLPASWAGPGSPLSHRALSINKPGGSARHSGIGHLLLLLPLCIRTPGVQNHSWNQLPFAHLTARPLCGARAQRQAMSSSRRSLNCLLIPKSLQMDFSG